MNHILWWTQAEPKTISVWVGFWVLDVFIAPFVPLILPSQKRLSFSVTLHTRPYQDKWIPEEVLVWKRKDLSFPQLLTQLRYNREKKIATHSLLEDRPDTSWLGKQWRNKSKNLALYEFCIAINISLPSWARKIMSHKKIMIFISWMIITDRKHKLLLSRMRIDSLWVTVGRCEPIRAQSDTDVLHCAWVYATHLQHLV